MKNRIRIFWLWLKHELEIASSFCQRCGARGAAVTSLVFPKRLCEPCAYELTKHIDKAPAMFGGTHIDPYPAKLATPLLIEEEDNIPCFDTYPASPPDAW